jgi:hypothetical protein
MVDWRFKGWGEAAELEEESPSSCSVAAAKRSSREAMVSGTDKLAWVLEGAVC